MGILGVRAFESPLRRGFAFAQAVCGLCAFANAQNVHWTDSNPSVCVVSILPDVCDTLDATFHITYPAIRFYLDPATGVGVRGKYRINGGSWIASGNPTLQRTGPLDETDVLAPEQGIVHPGPSGATIEAAVEAYLYVLNGTTNYLISASETKITAEALGV